MRRMIMMIMVVMVASVLGGCGTFAHQVKNFSPNIPDCAKNVPDKTYKVYVEPYHVKTYIGVTKHEWDREIYIKEALNKRLKAVYVESEKEADIIIKTEDVETYGSSELQADSITYINGDKKISKIIYPQNFGAWRDGKRDSIMYGKGDADLMTLVTLCHLNGRKISKASAVMDTGEDAHTYIRIVNIQVE